MSPISPDRRTQSEPESGAVRPLGPASGVPSSGKDTIGLLMDMEMPLLVRFGSARMSLSDILTLGHGSVVEFRRAPDEPVDLVVNGRVVARAQVVVVQGNYGMRILEIASQRDDLVSDPQPSARTIRENL